MAFSALMHVAFQVAPLTVTDCDKLHHTVMQEPDNLSKGTVQQWLTDYVDTLKLLESLNHQPSWMSVRVLLDRVIERMASWNHDFRVARCMERPPLTAPQTGWLRGSMSSTC